MFVSIFLSQEFKFLSYIMTFTSNLFEENIKLSSDLFSLFTALLETFPEAGRACK